MNRDDIEAMLAAAWDACAKGFAWKQIIDVNRKTMIDAAVAEAERRGLMASYDAASDGDQIDLITICKDFIREQEIGCVESIYQCDSVVENALKFIEKVCDEVGYFEGLNDD